MAEEKAKIGGNEMKKSLSLSKSTVVPIDKETRNSNMQE
jgi:hypothetical protein